MNFYLNFIIFLKVLFLIYPCNRNLVIAFAKLPNIVLTSNTIVNPNEIIDYANSLVDILTEATLPMSMGEVFAIGLSEGVSGLIGGLASRTVANIIGDIKKDNSVTKGAVSAVYFGSRGIFRSLSQIAGLPQPIAILIGDIAGSIASEGAKVVGRASNPIFKIAQQRRLQLISAVDVDDMEIDEFYLEEGLTTTDSFFKEFESYHPEWYEDHEDEYLTQNYWTTEVPPPSEDVVPVTDDLDTEQFFLDEFKEDPTMNTTSSSFSFISVPEVIMDVAKWVAYDLLVPDSENVQLLEAAVYGSISGVIAVLLIQFLQLIWKESMSLPDNVNIFTRLFRAGLEGGVLFWAYEGTLAFSEQELPEPLKTFLDKKFEKYFSNDNSDYF